MQVPGISAVVYAILRCNDGDVDELPSPIGLCGDVTENGDGISFGLMDHSASHNRVDLCRSSGLLLLLSYRGARFVSGP